MTRLSQDSAEFLHGLGYIYCKAGQPDRGIVFLLLASKIAPHDTAVLNSLATVFVETQAANRALAAIDRIEALEGEISSNLQLLKSRALWMRGEHDRARQTFRDYVKGRTPL